MIHPSLRPDHLRPSLRFGLPGAVTLAILSFSPVSHSLPVACTEDDCPPGGGGGGAGSPPPVTTDVGVIRELGATCPGETVEIYMDDEDDDNENDRSGWMGDVDDYRNTRIRFCKVSGQSFRALVGAAGNSSKHYAVLQLGTACPNGSVSFSRYFDDEDNDNQDLMSGPYSPNSYTRSNPSGSTWNFCLFDGSSAAQGSMSTWPSLGLQYGVFAPAGFTQSVGGGAGGLGFVYTDDEDDDNQNHYSSSPISATSIVSDGPNTLLRMAKVSGTPARVNSREDDVGPGYWMTSVVQYGLNGAVRGYTKLSNWNDLTSFEGHVFLVFLDSSQHPVWITSSHSWAAGYSLFTSPDQARNSWDETLPAIVRSKVKGFAVVQEDYLPCDFDQHFSNRELVSGWSDPVFQQYSDPGYVDWMMARTASAKTMW